MLDRPQSNDFLNNLLRNISESNPEQDAREAIFQLYLTHISAAQSETRSFSSAPSTASPVAFTSGDTFGDTLRRLIQLTDPQQQSTPDDSASTAAASNINRCSIM